MKVVCIRNKYEHELLLTIGKVYDVRDERSELVYLIVNDEGVKHFYAQELFIYLTELRDEKLNNLLE